MLEIAEYFVLLHSLTHAVPASRCCRSGYREGALHYGNASLMLCFWLFGTTTIELVVKNMAEVGAAGRYIYRSRWCADG